MSSLWDAILRRFRSVLVFACPFCTNDYQYANPNQAGQPQDEPNSDENLKKDVYTPRKGRHLRKDNKEEFVVVNEESGFSSKSDSNSQCPDVEVDNSDELNRILIRKSQFLPPEPYQPTPDDFAGKPLTLTRPATLSRQNATSPSPTSPRPLTPLQLHPAIPSSPDDFADSISQVSKKSKRSLFGFGKKKKKKDPDSQSVFSFASFKSGKSVSSKSEMLEKRERKRRDKEEKKDKKMVEKQELRLSHNLNNQKFENIYPWMNDLEPFDDEIEFPNVIEEIRIREAQELNKKDNLYEDRSFAAESYLDLGAQMMPISQISEPLAPVLVNRFGAPDDGVKKPFVPRLSPLVTTEPPKPSISPRPRQMSSDAETEGVVRKARKSLADVEPSVSVDSAPANPAVEQPFPFKKKDIFANVLPPGTSPEPVLDTFPTKNIETKSDLDEEEDRNLKREIEEVTQCDDYLQTLSLDISEHRSRRERKKKKRDDSRRKKKRSPTRIESNPIEDRSIDDIPVEKDADLTNPLLFPEPSVQKRKQIPIVNYTKTLDKDLMKKDDGDKVESIKEIKNTLEKRKKELSDQEPKKENKVKNVELKNETTRVIVDQDLAQNRMSYFDLDDGVLDHMNFRGVESERDLIIQHGSPSGSVPGQRTAAEKSSERKKRRPRESSERSGRRRDESEAERAERRKKRRESEGSQRRSRAASDDEQESRRRRRRRREESSGVKSEADAQKGSRERRESRGNRDRSRDTDRDSKKPRESKRDRSSRGDRDDSGKHRKKEKRSSKAESPTFSNDKPASGKERRSRKNSPFETYESNGQLKAIPSHIAKDIKTDMMTKKQQEFQEKKQLEIIRQKMDLDFQSVDTKRSVFISNDRPATSAPPSQTSSKQKSKKKDRKKSRESPTPAPKPKPKRVSSRPVLDPIKSQEEAVRPPPRVTRESDEDKSGSTLHSGDLKPRVIQRQASVTSNDSTLKDIGDIPSEYNVSVASRRVSVRSTDSRVSHRSQLAEARIGSPMRGASPAGGAREKKKKRKSIW